MTTEETPTEADVDEPTDDEAQTPDATPEADETEPETFPREYVTKLRDESAKYRQKAADRDEIAQRLHVALVAATGRLADPTDLPFNDEHLADPETLTTALDALLDTKPHLASRKPSGDVGQGATLTGTAVDLAGMLRRNAS